MALTRRDLLLASFVGFVAWGYVVHWLPILRYLGYAFVLGVILTVLLLLIITFTTSRYRQDGRKGSTITGSSIRFLASERWEAETSSLAADRRYRAAQLYSPSLVISNALDGLLKLALRDFIFSWYSNITSDFTFGNQIDRNIRLALGDIRDRLLQKDLVDIAVSRIVPLVTTHLRDFDQAERTIRGKALNRNVTESDELDLAIAAKYREGKLHPAASLAFSDTKLVQQEHLRKVLVRVLPEVLPDDVVKSRAVLALVKEIVACAVLFPVMQILADADTWIQLVEAYGRMAIQDRKTVRKLRAALDQHASPAPKSKQGLAFPSLAPGDNERSFERFVRAIRRTNNISDVRRFRSHIASQLKRESMVDNQDQTYLRRLEIGKRVLDQKVAKLSTGGSSSLFPRPAGPRNNAIAQSQNVKLVDMMKTASGLSYFMEYMDRLKLMSLVQYWIVVDGFRNPLEDDFGDDASGGDSIKWTDTDRADIAQISEAYMSRPELKVPEDMRAAIREFLRAGRTATPTQYRRARIAILSTQSAALEEMEGRHFPDFKTTDLFYKYLASDEASIISTPHVEPNEFITSPFWNGNEQNAKAPPMVRSNSQPPARPKDLRRAALSSTDLRAGPKLLETAADARKSLDIDRDRSGPLFEDDYDTDPLANSTHSLSKESQKAELDTQRRVIETMEAALNNIVSEPPKNDEASEAANKLFGSPTSLERSSKFDDSPKASLDMQHVDSANGERVRPSIASLGLVNTSSRIGVFSDDDLFPDEEKFIEDEYADSEDTSKDDGKDEEIHEAAPGDLGLAEAIAALTSDIERLVSQESVVDTLTRKAELTNNAAELRILSKSKSSLQREIRRKELQRQQYIVQESDNSLYGRSSVSIKSIMVGKEEDGHEYALYVIEVQRKAGEQMTAASWVVARRYSEFHDLHHNLRSRYPSVRHLDFPRRRVVMKLQREFLHKRRVALEAYLRQLLLLPEVCRSRELRSFLSQQAIIPQAQSTASSDAKDIVTRIYNSVTDGMDDFLGNIAILDQLSVAGQNLISAATTQMNATQNGSIPDDPTAIAEAEAELNAYEDRELEPFVKPICDLFLETFELNKGNNWLRGRAVVVVLHQLLGGTVERKVRDTVKGFLQEESVLRYIDLIKEMMWPGGGKLRESKPRTPAEKAKSKTEASVMLATLIPDLAANVVGRANAQAAARRIFATMNNERLNAHLAFTILDEIIAVLFGNEPGKAR
jgi:sorting nexin-25